MFKLKRKRIIEKNDIEAKKKIDVSSFVTQIKEFKGDFRTINKIVFDEISNVREQKDNAYIDANNARFNYLLFKKEYVDYKYIALQIYLLQQETDGFKYSEISKCLVSLIKFIEDSLLEGKTISFKDKFYISGATNAVVKIENKWFPRIFISKKKPEGITLSLKDIKINLDGIRELALYEEVTKNFDLVVINLLNTKKQILLENVLITKWQHNYVVVISKKFLFRQEKNTYNLETTFKSFDKSLSTKSNSLSKIENKKGRKKSKKLIYETQQIFLSKNDKNFKAVIAKHEKEKKQNEAKIKQDLKKIIKKTLIINKKTIEEEKEKDNLKLNTLNNEIEDINKLMDNIILNSKKTTTKEFKTKTKTKTNKTFKKKILKIPKTKKSGKHEK